METSEPVPPVSDEAPPSPQEIIAWPEPPPSRDEDAPPPRLLPEASWWPPEGWYVALYALVLLLLCLVRSPWPIVEVLRGALIFVVAIGFPESSRRQFQPHPRYWWAVLWCFALLMFTQVPGAIASAAVMILGMLVGGEGPGKGMTLDSPWMHAALGVGILVAHGLIILFSLLCLHLIAGRHWRHQVALRAPSASHAALVVLVAPAFIVLGGGAYSLLRYGLDVPTMGDLLKPFLPGGDAGPGPGPGPGYDMEEIEKVFGRWPLVLAVFLIGVMPGLSEELWCRAYLGRGLVGQHGYVLGVIRTSLLFGLIHVDPCQGAMAMLMGLMLHYVYLTTRSLVAPMLLHFLNNSMAVTLPRLPEVSKLAGEATELPWHLFFSAGLLLAAVCAALYLSRARLVTPPGEREWRPAWPGVACPPPGAPTHVKAPLPDALSVVLVVAAAASFAGSIALMLRP